MTAAQAKKTLQAFADSNRALQAQKYFKTARGEYAEGDKFIGVTVPDTRKVASQFKQLPISEIEKLLRAKIHEYRLLALIILVAQFQQAVRSADQHTQSAIYNFYLQQYRYINNWDLVDVSCRDIVGGYLLEKPAAQRKLLYDWAKSGHLWKRRIAIIATAVFIRAGRFQETLDIAAIFINDPHDLIHKASGWMLRELGKKDRQLLLNFLNQHSGNMPRTMLRYAIEKLPEKLRQHYLHKKPARLSDRL